MLDEDNAVLTMSDADWWVYLRDYINTFRGEIIKALIWVDTIDKMRQRRKCRSDVCQILSDPEEEKLNLWRDMVTEPEKYGDDIVEVLELEKELMEGPKRWRVAAFWHRLQAESDLMELKRIGTDSAVKIQAAWRGHQVRDTQEKLNCGCCLARKISPYRSGNMWVCYDCAEEADWVPCECCGYDVYIGHEGEYRDGFFCSRECAYGELSAWS